MTQLIDYLVAHTPRESTAGVSLIYAGPVLSVRSASGTPVVDTEYAILQVVDDEGHKRTDVVSLRNTGGVYDYEWLVLWNPAWIYRRARRLALNSGITELLLGLNRYERDNGSEHFRQWYLTPNVRHWIQPRDIESWALVTQYHGERLREVALFGGRTALRLSWTLPISYDRLPESLEDLNNRIIDRLTGLAFEGFRRYLLAVGGNHR